MVESGSGEWQWRVESGQRRVDGGEWGVGSGWSWRGWVVQRVEGGRWRVESVESVRGCKVEGGRWKLRGWEVEGGECGQRCKVDRVPAHGETLFLRSPS